MSNNLNEIIKSHFNIQNNPFIQLKNKYKENHNKELNNDDVDLNDTENNEYLNITSSNIYTDSPKLIHANNIEEGISQTPYHYLGEMLLNTSQIKLQKETIINVIIYRINDKGNKPFLEVCLYKIKDNQPCLDIPKVRWQTNNTPQELREKLQTTFKNYTTDVSYKGFYIDKQTKSSYLFYKLSHSSIIQDFSNTCLWNWVTIDEIINHKQTFDLTIHNDTYLFFINNEYFAYLEDIQGNIIEVPTTVYSCSDYKKGNVILTLGLLKQDTEAKYGPFYYFYLYEKAHQDAIDMLKDKNKDNNNEDNNEIYIIRFVLFMENTHVELNQTVRDVKSTIFQTEDTYDSLIKPSSYTKINNKLVYNHPIFVVKHSVQYMTLSYLRL